MELPLIGSVDCRQSVCSGVVALPSQVISGQGAPEKVNLSEPNISLQAIPAASRQSEHQKFAKFVVLNVLLCSSLGVSEFLFQLPLINLASEKFGIRPPSEVTVQQRGRANNSSD